MLDIKKTVWLAVLGLASMQGSLAAGVVESDNSVAERETYVRKLSSGYMGRIQFQTPYARQVVADFKIDCNARDGRALPLINVMLAKLKSMDGQDMWMAARVDSRGEDVHIYDRMVRKGHIVDEQLAFQLDKWGTLQVKNVRTEAILNACFGSFGPIWVYR